MSIITGIISREGVSSLYRGAVLSVAGVVPYAGINLAVNSVLRERAAAHYDAQGREPSMAVPLACGMIASTTAMVSTYPLGLVRTRIQMSGMPGAPAYSGPVDVVMRTVAAEGWRGLFRGLTPNMLKVVPAGALSAATYSMLSDRLRSIRPPPEVATQQVVVIAADASSSTNAAAIGR